MEINPYSALSSVGQAAADSQSIADNFETFLTLLTTQLRHQNPLDPLDTNEFTSQLVQFTEVEQAVKANKNLETLMQLAAGSVFTSTLGYLGTEVTAAGSTATLSGGAAQWNYNAAAASQQATFSIYDSSGRLVYEETRSISEGEGTYTWNGIQSDGTTAPDGAYDLVIKAVDSQGYQISVSTAVTGIVDGVDLSGSEPILTVGGREIKLYEITAIKTPSGG